MEYTSGSLFISQYWALDLLTRRSYFSPALLGNATSTTQALRAPLLRGLLVLALWLTSNLAAAQAQPKGFDPFAGSAASPALRATRPERFARTAAWLGLVNGTLLISGTVAITVMDDPESERVLRSVHLGLTALSAPLVALSSWNVRKKAGVEGLDPARSLGWAAYTGAVAIGVGELYGAFDGAPSSTNGLTVFSGVLAALSVLPHALDAYASARQSRVRRLWFEISPLGIRGGF